MKATTAILYWQSVSWFFKMLMTAENANTDLPPIGFCNELLLGSEGCAQFNFLAICCDFTVKKGSRQLQT
jgi:hypothetical protein